MKKILFVSGREPGYVRNKILLQKFSQEYEVDNISSTKKSFIARHIQNYYRIIRKIGHLKDYEFVFVGFYGFFIVPFVRLFTKNRIVFDAFLSTYDTLQSQQDKFNQLGFLSPFAKLLFSKKGIFSKFAFWLDKYVCKISDEVWLDTKVHKDYFVDTFDIDSEKIKVKYLGADVIFRNKKELDESKLEKFKNDDSNFRVFYYGSGLEIQGIDVILKAAKSLEANKDIEFLVGGPIKKNFSDLIKELDLRNVRFVGWIQYDELPYYIASADLCLGGHFSSIEKAKRVIAGKTFQFLSVGVKTIVGDNQANKELKYWRGWQNTENLIFYCSVNNPASLAKLILEIKKDEKA